MAVVDARSVRVRTLVLVSAALVSAVLVNLAVLAPGVAPPLGDFAGDPIVVDVTVPSTAAVPTSTPPAPPPSGTPASVSAPAATSANPAAVATSSGTPVVTPRASAPATPSGTPPATSPSPPPTTLPSPQPTTTAPPPTTAYRTVTYEGVGDVVIADPGDGTIEFWSCRPAPGWAYQVENDGPSLVEVKFRRTSGEGEAKVLIRRRSDGSLSVEREG